jgi:putative DNA primase/helicase
VVCFGSGRVRAVAAELRQQDATARIVLVPDVGKESDAQKIALEIRAAVAYMPEGEENNFDANDLKQRDGADVLASLLEAATESTLPPPLPLSVAFADELPEAFTPPDELVEGVLTAGDGSVLYGDSNSGKTFFVIDMAAAVARGVPWMGKNTEKGLVIYLAAESPASVRSRLQAYQKHHGVRVPNFAIVQSPIDLFAGDADTDAVIAVVQELERQRGQKARLIVGDTLARLSAGANENAGQDMGLVVRRIDRIRTACAAHFLLIHHSGKVAANGARGWSGIKAAVDTEIEVTDSLAGKCAEITKQRDLSTKGERIGFLLKPVTLGQTKWGAPATSCVVVATDAPLKQARKRMSECDGAVLEFLVAHKVGIRKAKVVGHFKDRYKSGPIYRAMKALVTAGAVHQAAGMVCPAEVAK